MPPGAALGMRRVKGEFEDGQLRVNTHTHTHTRTPMWFDRGEDPGWVEKSDLSNIRTTSSERRTRFNGSCVATCSSLVRKRLHKPSTQAHGLRYWRCQYARRARCHFKIAEDSCFFAYTAMSSSV